MKSTFLYILAALGLTAFTVSPASAADRPNIVMIVSDDHGWTDYGFMGHEQVCTPHLDRLAGQSLVYTRGYSTSSLCCPSLASIITGQYPHQSKIANNDPPKTNTPGKPASRDEAYLKGRKEMVELISKTPTLPGLLAKEGYVGFQTGKWWQGHFSTGGFTHGMSLGDPEKGGRHGDAGLTIGRKTMQPVYDFIEQAGKDKKPFFVWYAPMLPHSPHDAPEKYLNKYKEKTKSLHVAKYWANVEWFDDTCGQLLDYLDQHKLADNTIVVYVTDNGWIQDPNTAKATRSKLTQYDAGHRTPIVIRWPGKVKAGKSTELASAIDLMPTLLRAVGLKPTEAMQGVNLLDPATMAQRKAIFGECFAHDAVEIDNPASSLRWRWVIEGDWKLIVPHKQNEKNAVVELYNVVADPEEKSNLAEKEKDKVESMQKKLDAWWNPK